MPGRRRDGESTAAQLPGRASRDRQPRRPVRPHARRGRGRGAYVVRRHQPLPTLRTPSNAAEPLSACRGGGSDGQLGVVAALKAGASLVFFKTVARDDEEERRVGLLLLG